MCNTVQRGGKAITLALREIACFFKARLARNNPLRCGKEIPAIAFYNDSGKQSPDILGRSYYASGTPALSKGHPIHEQDFGRNDGGAPVNNSFGYGQKCAPVGSPAVLYTRHTYNTHPHFLFYGVRKLASAFLIPHASASTPLKLCFSTPYNTSPYGLRKLASAFLKNR